MDLSEGTPLNQIQECHDTSWSSQNMIMLYNPTEQGRKDVLMHSFHVACAAEDIPYAGILAYTRLTWHLRDGAFGLRGPAT